MEIKKIGVVGLGDCGHEFAWASARAGYQVIAMARDDSKVKRGLTRITSRLNEQIKEGKLTDKEKNTIMSRIKGTADLKDFYDCDIVVENIVEDIERKKQLLVTLDSICPAHTIFGVNTGGLPIGEIGAVTKRPDKVIGMHSVPVRAPFIELIKALRTSEETLETSKEYAKALGLLVVVARDGAGAIMNNLLIPFLLSAIRSVEAGNSPKDIDTIFTVCFGHPIGPITLVDMAGLDNTLSVAEGLFYQTKDPKFAPPVLLRKMVAAGWYGPKTGKGFYEYK